jgi:hypothetical protein
MQDDIASFLSFQVRRAGESGDSEATLAQLRNFLELERQAKLDSIESASDKGNVRTLPFLRAVQ